MPDRRRSPNCPVTRSGNPGQSPTDAWLTALLAAEVHRAIARIVGPRRLGRVVRAQPAFVLGWVERHFEGPEALEAGVRPHQRPIRAHVPTHEPRRQRTRNGRVEELNRAGSPGELVACEPPWRLGARLTVMLCHLELRRRNPLERRELDVLRLEQPDHALRHRVADEGGDNAECES